LFPLLAGQFGLADGRWQMGRDWAMTELLMRGWLDGGMVDGWEDVLR